MTHFLQQRKPKNQRGVKTLHCLELGKLGSHVASSLRKRAPLYSCACCLILMTHNGYMSSRYQSDVSDNPSARAACYGRRWTVRHGGDGKSKVRRWRFKNYTGVFKNYKGNLENGTKEVAKKAGGWTKARGSLYLWQVVSTLLHNKEQRSPPRGSFYVLPALKDKTPSWRESPNQINAKALHRHCCNTTAHGKEKGNTKLYYFYYNKKITKCLFGAATDAKLIRNDLLLLWLFVFSHAYMQSLVFGLFTKTFSSHLKFGNSRRYF